MRMGGLSTRIAKEWSFSNATQRDTGYITHCYHRYPAKFIPQLANRIITQFSNEGDTVADPFAGCGTSLVESKILGRNSIGIDINPVACMITEAKITPVNPAKLQNRYRELCESFKEYSPSLVEKHARIKHWFNQDTILKLDYILRQIKNIKAKEERVFFLCSFSNILKNCSIWSQKSNKPLRDLHKVTADPFTQFNKQFAKMYRGAVDFYNLLEEKGRLHTDAKIYCEDARNTKQIPSNSIDLIVTSPPYVTSYEYADLHQLSLLWMDHVEDLPVFREKFIGSLSSCDSVTHCSPAFKIVEALRAKDRRMASSVAGYFASMDTTFKEMYRITKAEGKVAIVIGDTKLKNVGISNASIFLQCLRECGFTTIKTIKREIPSKNIPSTRDPKTGRFTSVNNSKKVLAYPTEYILIVQK